MPLPSVGTIFIGLAVIFFSLALSDRFRSERQSPVTRRVRIRLALIFAAVGLGLHLLRVLMR